MKSLILAASKSVMALAAIIISSAVLAHDYQADSIKIDHPWSREAPPNAKVIAGFFQLKNGGTQDDFLIAASTPIAERVEIHTHEMVGEMMKMRQVESVRVGSMQTVSFQPGGFHLMIFAPNKVLKQGDRFPLTLTFKNAGSVEVEIAVEESGHQHEH